VQSILASLRSNITKAGQPVPGNHTTAAPPSQPAPAVVAADLDENKRNWDCLKLVRFRHPKLGLTLAPVSVLNYGGLLLLTRIAEKCSDASQQATDRSGTRYGRVVVMAKHHELLEPQVDRLLCVGDELVTVQGQAVELCGNTFHEVLERLRVAPRPLELGFLPAAR
jgi:hypothetical protein